MRRTDKRPDFFQNVFDAFNQLCALPDKPVRTLAPHALSDPGDRENFPALLQGKTGGYQRTAPFGGFHYDNAERKTADYAVSRREIARSWGRAQWKFRQQGPGAGYFLPEIGVDGRIVHIQPAAQNGKRPSTGFERPAVRGGVDAERKAAHDGNAASSQIGGQFFGKYDSRRERRIVNPPRQWRPGLEAASAPDENKTAGGSGILSRFDG